MACASGEGFQSHLSRQRISGRTGNEAGAASFLHMAASRSQGRDRRTRDHRARDRRARDHRTRARRTRDSVML